MEAYECLLASSKRSNSSTIGGTLASAPASGIVNCNDLFRFFDQGVVRQLGEVNNRIGGSAQYWVMVRYV